MQRIRNALRNERGATAVEYSVMVFLIAAVIVISIASLGSATNSSIDCTGKSWQNGTTSCASSPSSSPTSSPAGGSGGNNGGSNGNGGVGNGNGNGNTHH